MPRPFNDRQCIEREIEAGIRKMQHDLGIVRKPIGSTLAEWAMVGCIIAAGAFIFVVKAKAQQLNPGDLSPGPVWCSNSASQVKKIEAGLGKILKKPVSVREVRPISGGEAAYWSNQVFGYAPPVDHMIVVPISDGRTILLPCMNGPHGPYWAGSQSSQVRAVAIDTEYQRTINTPKTDIPQPNGVDQLPKPKKRTRKAEAKN